MNPECPSSTSEDRRRLMCSRSSSQLSSGSDGSVDSAFTMSSTSSPVTNLTFDLQVLSTHGLCGGRGETKVARRKLSLNLSSFNGSPSATSSSFLPRRISTDDDGCFSPDSSGSQESLAYDSPFMDNLMANSFEPKFRAKRSFKRYSSVPATISPCLTSVQEVHLRHSMENVAQCGGRNDENKENEVKVRETEGKKSVSFKLPTSPAPRGIMSPFKDETNRLCHGAQEVSYKSPRTPAKAYGRPTQRTLSRHSSNDDSFLEKLEVEEDSTESRLVPKGLEGLFFSPVIEGNESDASPIVHVGVSADVDAGKENVGTGIPHSPCAPKLIRRKYSAQDIRISYKRSESQSQDTDLTPLQLKRWKGLTKDKDEKSKDGATEKRAASRRITRCHSETEIFIKTALSWEDSQQNLIGDFSRPFCLPLVNGKHQDLKAISPQTMADIFNDCYKEIVENCIVIDCRYPYEFDGGHIQGALNIYTTEDLITTLFSDRTLSSASIDGFSSDPKASSSSNVSEKRSILVFHCEFSSERGPKLSRFLRNRDRDTNIDSYPALSYPEIYLLEGGYKAFYESFPQLCLPQDYVPMLQQDHLTELKMYRSKANSWAVAEKARTVGRGAGKHAHPSLNL